MGIMFRLTSAQPQLVEMYLGENSCLWDVGELVGFHGNSQTQRLIQKAAQKVAKGKKKSGTLALNTTHCSVAAQGNVGAVGQSGAVSCGSVFSRSKKEQPSRMIGKSLQCEGWADRNVLNILLLPTCIFQTDPWQGKDLKDDKMS